MTYEDRVMKRVITARDRVNLLQQRLLHERKQPGRGELVGELESIKNELTRTLLEPVSDADAADRKVTLVRQPNHNEESP